MRAGRVAEASAKQTEHDGRTGQHHHEDDERVMAPGRVLLSTIGAG